MSNKIVDRKNILVTGGAGFIGSVLCAELVKKNNVICLDNFITSGVENIRFLLQEPHFEFIRSSINDPLKLEDLPELKKFMIKTQGIQEVYNLACPTSAKNFDSLIIETALANSVGVKNVLDLAAKYQAELLHMSSVVVYGPRQLNQIAVKETDLGSVDILSPRACYDEGKRFAESMVNTFSFTQKRNYKIARIFRTFGPHMLLRDGQMLPDFVMSAIANDDLIIYGDASFSTSLCYVDDVVQGLIKLMASKHGGAYNFGGEQEYNLTEVAERIIRLTGSSSKIVYKEPLKFMTPLAIPDLTKVKADLGWFPVVDLDQGLQKLIDYTKAYQSLVDSQSNA